MRYCKYEGINDNGTCICGAPNIFECEYNSNGYCTQNGNNAIRNALKELWFLRFHKKVYDFDDKQLDALWLASESLRCELDDDESLASMLLEIDSDE